MGEAVGAMLASAAGIAIGPRPLIAAILMLAAPRGRANALALTAGRAAALGAIVAVVVAVAVTAGSRPAPGGEPTWSSWLKLALGTLLVLLALGQWRDRPREGHVTAPPGWMRSVRRFTAGRSARLGAALAAASPKDVVLAVGGAASVAASPTSGAGKAVAGTLLVLIASLCTLLPLAVHLLGGDGSARTLGEWKAWMSAHHTAITTTVLAVLGTTYLGDALTGLA
ncbi:GAP family protein [Kitasatospora sp. NPDC059408]|uniref:GAP family protein n=1 Tax=Kitasatospora sp. NPDC059408 TaxID=3346823 RepID=UPI00367C26D1